MATVYKIELCSHWVNYSPEELKKVLEKALKESEISKRNEVTIDEVKRKERHDF